MQDAQAQPAISPAQVAYVQPPSPGVTDRQVCLQQTSCPSPKQRPPSKEGDGGKDSERKPGNNLANSKHKSGVDHSHLPTCIFLHAFPKSPAPPCCTHSFDLQTLSSTATLWARFPSVLQRLQGPCTKSRNLSNSTCQSFPSPAGAKATSRCRAAVSQAPGTAASPRGFSESSWVDCFPSPLFQQLFSLTFLSPVPGYPKSAYCCSCSVTNSLTSVLGYQKTHPSSR